MSKISRTKGTIRFAFRESNTKLKQNKKKESIIILNFAYGKTRFRYSTGYKSCFEDWDFKRSRVRNKASILNKDEINDHLNGLEKFLYKTYSELSKEEGDVPVDVLKYHLDVYTKKIEPNKDLKKNLSFFEVIDEFIKVKEDKPIAPVTIRSYKQTKKRLEEYQKSKKTRR